MNLCHEFMVLLWADTPPYRTREKKGFDKIEPVGVSIQKRNKIVVHDKAKPFARVGRKAKGLQQTAGLPKYHERYAAPAFFVGTLREREVETRNDRNCPAGATVRTVPRTTRRGRTDKW